MPNAWFGAGGSGYVHKYTHLRKPIDLHLDAGVHNQGMAMSAVLTHLFLVAIMVTEVMPGSELIRPLTC